MPNIQDAFPSKYLKAADLNGTEPVLVMSHVEFEPVGQKKEMKAVLYFQGKEKGLVLNVTNSKKITGIAGTAMTEEWKGKRIRLFASETEYQGETVDCIRVKAAAQKAPPVKAAPPPPDDEDESHDYEDSDVPF